MSSSDSTLPPVNVGMSNADRMQIVDGLSRLLADTYTLYLKTHNFHWNEPVRCFRRCISYSCLSLIHI